MPFAENPYTDEELPYWLAFDRLTGVGLNTVKIVRLHELFFSLSAAWQASRTELKDISFHIGMTDAHISKFLESREKIDPADLLKQLQASGAEAYPFLHELYPQRLREIHDPPLVLYYKGHLPMEDTWNTVAVVGSRHPTAYGQKLAKEFAYGLAASGVTVLSGMAFGVDSLAHRAAFEAKGKTMAVFGCGVDVCYPSSNRPLYKMLVEDDNGACLSEFFPGTTPEPWRFPARNRIIAGIAAGCLVIEAGDVSGALITARIAFEQSRQVFSIPGRIDSQLSIGTNRIISNHQAQLVTSYEQVLTELGWTTVPKLKEVPTLVQLYGREMEVYQLISAEPVHFDVLCERTGMQAGELSATLTMLELAGVVNRLQGDWYARN